MSSVILVASVVIWLLGYFPRQEGQSIEVQQENSYIATIGKAVSPVLEPLGFDWKVSVCLLTGFAAKETIVSTMGVLGTAPTPERPVFPIPVAIALIVFVLLYSPCIATIGACAKESSWKWALFMVVYTTFIAWITALLAFNIVSLIV